MPQMPRSSPELMTRIRRVTVSLPNRPDNTQAIVFVDAWQHEEAIDRCGPFRFLSVRKDAVESHFEMLTKHLDNAWNDFYKRSQTRVWGQTLGHVGSEGSRSDKCGEMLHLAELNTFWQIWNMQHSVRVVTFRQIWKLRQGPELRSSDSYGYVCIGF